MHLMVNAPLYVRLFCSAPLYVRLSRSAPLCIRLSRSAPLCIRLYLSAPRCVTLSQSAPLYVRLSRSAPLYVRLYLSASLCVRLSRSSALSWSTVWRLYRSHRALCRSEKWCCRVVCVTARLVVVLEMFVSVAADTERSWNCPSRVNECCRAVLVALLEIL